MENKKDIGKAFRDKIDGLEKSPRPEVWDSIHAELKKKKKRRLLPFWIKTIGITLLFLLLLLPFSTLEWNHNFPFYNTKTNSTKDSDNKNSNIHSNDKKENSVTITSNTTTDNQKVNINKDITISKDNIDNSSKASRNSINISKNKSKNTVFATSTKNEGKLTSKNLTHSSKAAKSKNKKSKASTKSSKKAIPSKNIALHQDANTTDITDKAVLMTNQKTSAVNKESDLSMTEKKKDSLKEKKKEKKAETKEEKKTVKDSIKPFSKFYVFGYAAPTYYGIFSNKSTIDNRLENNKSSSEITFNFGGYIGVYMTEKVNLRLGASFSKFNTTTKNVNFGTGNFENIKYNPGITNSSIVEEFDSETLDIREEYSFLEIPFEIKYTILEKKIGIEAIGGFSTLYLNKNSIEVEKNNQSIVIGKRNDLLKVHFTLNLGASFYYKISEDLRFNAEPIFKYHFNPSAESPKKLSFGIQTGLQYNLNN